MSDRAGLAAARICPDTRAGVSVRRSLCVFRLVLREVLLQGRATMAMAMAPRFKGAARGAVI
jgi:hypothetical protein